MVSVAEVVETLRATNDYDLIFADIRLGNQLVFDAFQTVMPECFVVFTTAYDEYALEAFHNNGIDYLMKPIDPDELRKAIDKAKFTNNSFPTENTFGRTIAQMEAHYRKRIVVSKGDEIISIPTGNICFIRKDDYVRIYLYDGTSYLVQFTLNDLEQILDPDEFFRINRQYIANINSFKKISNFFNSRLIVRLRNCDDDKIVVSKDRSAKFKEWLAL